MSDYRNFGHYIAEGWQAEPKESFKILAAHLMSHAAEPKGALLDVGCATGELLGFLGSKFPGLSVTGVDVFDELLQSAHRLLPGGTFANASALDLPVEFRDRFDFVTAIGVMSIFDEDQLARFWENLLSVTKPGGFVAVLSPLNEYGVDLLARHRKRKDGHVLPWETGWNVFSHETVRETLRAQGQAVSSERFVFKPVLPRKEDPVRTWTLPTADHPHQLTNGLKLLIDHYFMLVRKKSVGE
jgi:trans-aconitate methyltransferase